MGEEVLPSYLRSKLSSILDEAEADSGSPSHTILRFRSIETQIKSNSPVDLLYELIGLVSECRVFSFERRTAAVSKKGFGFYFLKLLRHPPISQLMFNRRMSRRLDFIERKIKACTVNREPSQPPAPIIEETHPIEDTSLIIGFEAEADKIEAWLMPSQGGGGGGGGEEEEEEEEEEEGDDAAAALKLRAVGIVGRCGCGKTALAQKVFNSPSVKEEFSPRIWVCLSNMLLDDDRKVRGVNHILREIDEDDDDDRSLDNLMEKLQRGLRGKRYLIVLDNAWRLDEWYEELFSNGLSGGGAVIVTSRREDVTRRMIGDDKHMIRLQPHLSDEIYWQIFTQVLQQQGKLDLTHPNISSIEDDVKRNFDGLPLAAKILANILPDLLFKTYWVRARDLIIGNGDDGNWWRWTFLPPPQEMEEVAELVGDKVVYISGRVELKELFRNTSYSAYLVFKLKMKDPQNRAGEGTAVVRIVNDINGHEVEFEPPRGVNLTTEGKQRKGEEEQGWMEINLGHFFTYNLGHHGRFFKASFFDSYFKPPGSLVVKGIEFRAD